MSARRASPLAAPVVIPFEVRAARAISRWAWPVVGFGVAAGWTAAAMTGGRGWPLAAAAASGAALLAATLPVPADLLRGVQAVGSLVLVPIAVGEAVRGSSAGWMLAAAVLVAGVGVVAAARDGASLIGPVVLAVGVAAVTAGVAADSATTDVLRLAVVGDAAGAALIGGALVAAAGVALGVDDATPLVPALLAGLVAAPAWSGSTAAVVAVSGAVALAGAALRRPVLTFAGLAIAAAALPVVAAARLFAGGATVAAVLGGGPVVALGLPGAVALAHHLAQAGYGAPEVTAGAALALAALLSVVRPGRTAALTAGHAAALAAGAWLAVAPGTWAWVGSADLDAYDVGAARGVGVGLLVAVAVAVWTRAELSPTWWPGADGSVRPPPAGPLHTSGPTATALAVAGVAVLGAAAGWLVLSAVRLR